MNILIKNMEMPKNCAVCPLRVDGLHTFQCMRLLGRAYTYELVEQRQEDCPLVELPDNHGRIVDLDRVLDWLANDKRCFSMAMTSKIEKALSDAPVILEASK